MPLLRIEYRPNCKSIMRFRSRFCSFLLRFSFAFACTVNLSYCYRSLNIWENSLQVLSLDRLFFLPHWSQVCRRKCPQSNCSTFVCRLSTVLWFGVLKEWLAACQAICDHIHSTNCWNQHERYLRPTYQLLSFTGLLATSIHTTYFLCRCAAGLPVKMF